VFVVEDFRVTLGCRLGVRQVVADVSDDLFEAVEAGFECRQIRQLADTQVIVVTG